jgi:hypothetical protein
VSTRDKIAFCSATGNIFVTALLLGMAPEKLPIWYTGQMAYYMPLRYFSYHRRGYHYFIADLCYWVNLMVFQLQTLLMIACPLSMGISFISFPPHRDVLSGIWISSMGYHRLAKLTRIPQLVQPSIFQLTCSDKVVSLFIHIMPPTVLHTVLHLLPKEYSHVRYPALQQVPHLDFWRGFWISSVVHMAWQGWYYFFIMVRRRDKIEAGRPTSFTWLRKSYSKTWIGKWLNGLPAPLQPIAFMGIQVPYPSI